MRIKCLFFAVSRDLTGVTEVNLDCAEGTTSKTISQVLLQKYPRLASILSRSIISVNSEYTETERVLQESDEVAVIPPVSGG